MEFLARLNIDLCHARVHAYVCERAVA